MHIYLRSVSIKSAASSLIIALFLRRVHLISFPAPPQQMFAVSRSFAGSRVVQLHKKEVQIHKSELSQKEQIVLCFYFSGCSLLVGQSLRVNLKHSGFSAGAALPFMVDMLLSKI